MKLMNKRILMLVADGVDQQECDLLRRGFEEEGADIFCTTHVDYVTVETVFQGKRGRDLVIDLPFEAVEMERFDGLILPDGYLAAMVSQDDDRIIALIQSFHEKGLPIFASGKAVDLLYRSEVLSDCVLVREGTPLTSFINQAVRVLSEGRAAYAYRSRTAA